MTGADPMRPTTRCPFATRPWLGWAFAGLLAAALIGLHGCQLPQKAGPDGACATGRDCAFGLECKDKVCKFIAFSDCDPEAQSQGRFPCLNGQKCRDGKCTVYCASNDECKESGGLCKVGVCVKTNKDLRQCVDNRDCIWPESCFHGQCVTRTDAFRCASDLDCGLGFRCINSRCQ